MSDQPLRRAERFGPGDGFEYLGHAYEVAETFAHAHDMVVFVTTDREMLAFRRNAPVPAAPVPSAHIFDVTAGSKLWHSGDWRTVVRVAHPSEQQPWDPTRVWLEGVDEVDGAHFPVECRPNRSYAALPPTEAQQAA